MRSALCYCMGNDPYPIGANVLGLIWSVGKNWTGNECRLTRYMSTQSLSSGSLVTTLLYAS